MRRYLVVANYTLGGERLKQKVQACLAEGPARFHIVVPATRRGHPGDWDFAFAAEDARAGAQRRLDRALALFRELGAEADGAVGAADPMDAVEDALRSNDYDEIIISTLPARVSRWLKWDLPGRVRRRFKTAQVTHIEAREEELP